MSTARPRPSIILGQTLGLPPAMPMPPMASTSISAAGSPSAEKAEADDNDNDNDNGGKAQKNKVKSLSKLRQLSAAHQHQHQHQATPAVPKANVASEVEVGGTSTSATSKTITLTLTPPSSMTARQRSNVSPKPEVPFDEAPSSGGPVTVAMKRNRNRIRNRNDDNNEGLGSNTNINTTNLNDGDGLPPKTPTGDSKPKPKQKQKEQLPKGWKSTIDPTSSKTYYYNRASGQISWDKPELLTPAAADAAASAVDVDVDAGETSSPSNTTLPSINIIDISNSSKKNKNKTLSKWKSADKPDLPTPETAAVASADDARESSSPSTTASSALSNTNISINSNGNVSNSNSSKKTKSKWKSAVDVSSGKTYYYHRASGKVSWDKPAELASSDLGEAEASEKSNSASRMNVVNGGTIRVVSTNDDNLVTTVGDGKRNSLEKKRDLDNSHKQTSNNNASEPYNKTTTTSTARDDNDTPVKDSIDGLGSFLASKTQSVKSTVKRNVSLRSRSASPSPLGRIRGRSASPSPGKLFINKQGQSQLDSPKNTNSTLGANVNVSASANNLDSSKKRVNSILRTSQRSRSRPSGRTESGGETKGAERVVAQSSTLYTRNDDNLKSPYVIQHERAERRRVTFKEDLPLYSKSILDDNDNEDVVVDNNDGNDNNNKSGSRTISWSRSLSSLPSSAPRSASPLSRGFGFSLPSVQGVQSSGILQRPSSPIISMRRPSSPIAMETVQALMSRARSASKKNVRQSRSTSPVQRLTSTSFQQQQQQPDDNTTAVKQRATARLSKLNSQMQAQLSRAVSCSSPIPSMRDILLSNAAVTTSASSSFYGSHFLNKLKDCDNEDYCNDDNNTFDECGSSVFSARQHCEEGPGVFDVEDDDDDEEEEDGRTRSISGGLVTIQSVDEDEVHSSRGEPMSILCGGLVTVQSVDKDETTETTTEPMIPFNSRGEPGVIDVDNNEPLNNTNTSLNTSSVELELIEIDNEQINLSLQQQQRGLKVIELSKSRGSFLERRNYSSLSHSPFDGLEEEEEEFEAFEVPIGMMKKNQSSNENHDEKKNQSSDENKGGGRFPRSFSWRRMRSAGSASRQSRTSLSTNEASPTGVADELDNLVFSFEQKQKEQQSAAVASSASAGNDPDAQADTNSGKQLSSPGERLVDEDAFEIRCNKLSTNDDGAKQRRRRRASALSLLTRSKITKKKLHPMHDTNSESNMAATSHKSNEGQPLSPGVTVEAMASSLELINGEGAHILQKGSGDMMEGDSQSFPKGSTSADNFYSPGSDGTEPTGSNEEGESKHHQQELGEQQAAVPSTPSPSSHRRDTSTESPMGVDELFFNTDSSKPFIPSSPVRTVNDKDDQRHGNDGEEEEPMNISNVELEMIEEEEKYDAQNNNENRNLRVNSGLLRVIEQSRLGSRSEVVRPLDLHDTSSDSSSQTSKGSWTSRDIATTRSHASEASGSSSETTSKRCALDAVDPDEHDDGTLWMSTQSSSSIGKKPIAKKNLSAIDQMKCNLKPPSGKSLSPPRIRDDQQRHSPSPPEYEAYEITYKARPPASSTAHPASLTRHCSHAAENILKLTTRARHRLNSPKRNGRTSPFEKTEEDDDHQFGTSDFSIVSAVSSQQTPPPPPPLMDLMDSLTGFGIDDDNTFTTAGSMPKQNLVNNIMQDNDSDVNSMSAIYSQDEEKHIERAVLTKEIPKENNIFDDFHSVAYDRMNDEDDDSAMTDDTSIDIHYLSRLDLALEEQKESKSKSQSKRQLHSNKALDCNYGTSLENVYEEFGIERKLVPLNEEEKKRQIMANNKWKNKHLRGGVGVFAGMLPHNKGNNNTISSPSSSRPFPVSNPIDVDEVSLSVASIRSNASKNSFKTNRSNDCDNDVGELVKLDNFKWLMDPCGATDWGDDDYDTYLPTCQGGRSSHTKNNILNESRLSTAALDEMEADSKDFAFWDGDIGKLDFDKVIDVMDYAINGNACEVDFEDFDAKTVGDRSYYDDGDEYTRKEGNGVDEDEEECNSQKTAKPPKHAVANTDAIRMQQVVFVAPNVENPSSTIEFLG